MRVFCSGLNVPLRACRKLVGWLEWLCRSRLILPENDAALKRTFLFATGQDQPAFRLTFQHSLGIGYPSDDAASSSAGPERRFFN